MIKEDYVSFETAKRLKEKGFDESTTSQYLVYGIHYGEIGEYNITDRSRNPENYIPAPTLQMAMKWLRDEKGIAIIPIIHSILDYEKFLWDIKIAVAKTNETFSQGWVYENPENGYDWAVRYCLENLI